MDKNIERGLDKSVEASKCKDSASKSLNSDKAKSDTEKSSNPSIYYFRTCDNNESSYECCRMC